MSAYVYEIDGVELPSLEQIEVEEFDAFVTNAPCEFQGSMGLVQPI